MRRTLVALALALGLALAVPACSRTGPQSADNAAQAPTVLRVENQSFYDMDIYMVRQAGDRVRIGSVSSQQTANLTIPSGLLFGLTNVRFVARPLAGPGAEVSQDIAVAAGDTVVMTIQR